MLISQCYQDKNKSKYTCDKCKINIRIKNMYKIYVQAPEEKITKKWDLCTKCYEKIFKD